MTFEANKTTQNTRCSEKQYNNCSTHIRLCVLFVVSKLVREIM